MNPWLNSWRDRAPLASGRRRAWRGAWLLGVLMVCLSVSLATRRAQAADQKKPAPPNADQAADQEKLDQRFQQTLSGAVLSGSFTRSDQPDRPLREDRYTIDRIKKLQNGYWLFDARIQYEGRDMKVPLPLLVRWAGDTPVITVDQVLVPGLGVFSARVLIFDHQYAGTWSAGDHGGLMFGRIVHEPATEKKNEAAAPEGPEKKPDSAGS